MTGGRGADLFVEYGLSWLGEEEEEEKEGGGRVRSRESESDVEREGRRYRCAVGAFLVKSGRTKDRGRKRDESRRTSPGKARQGRPRYCLAPEGYLSPVPQ